MRWMRPGAACLTAALLGVGVPGVAAVPESSPDGIGFPLRVGVGVTPLVGYSPLTYAWGEVHTLSNGGWVPITIGPALRLWDALCVELGVTALVPVEDAWGFPDFRVAIVPAVRWDGEVVYARLGFALMAGDGLGIGVEAAVGVTVGGPLYVGVTTFGSLEDLIIGNGVEVGLRFDHLRLSGSR